MRNSQKNINQSLEHFNSANFIITEKKKKKSQSMSHLNTFCYVNKPVLYKNHKLEWLTGWLCLEYFHVLSFFQNINICLMLVIFNFSIYLTSLQFKEAASVWYKWVPNIQRYAIKLIHPVSTRAITNIFISVTIF